MRNTLDLALIIVIKLSLFAGLFLMSTGALGLAGLIIISGIKQGNPIAHSTSLLLAGCILLFFNGLAYRMLVYLAK